MLIFGGFGVKMGKKSLKLRKKLHPVSEFSKYKYNKPGITYFSFYSEPVCRHFSTSVFPFLLENFEKYLILTSNYTISN